MPRHTLLLYMCSTHMIHVIRRRVNRSSGNCNWPEGKENNRGFSDQKACTPLHQPVPHLLSEEEFAYLNRTSTQAYVSLIWTLVNCYEEFSLHFCTYICQIWAFITSAASGAASSSLLVKCKLYS